MLVAVVIAALASRAHADDELARAHQLETALEYDQALAIVEGVLARGGTDPARYVELQLFAGKLAAGLDRVQAAQDHFARALAVRPDATLPEGTSPKLTEPFAAAKSRTAPLGFRVTVVEGLVTLTTTDPLGLVVGIAVHVVDSGGQHRDLVERASTRLAIPPNTKPIEIAALDANGNRLWVGSPPPPIDKPIVRPPPPRSATPLAQRWTTYAVITGAALVAGSISAWRFDVAQNDWNRLHDDGHDFTELRAVEDRGRRWGLAANASFAVAAAAGIATAVFAIRNHQSDVVVTAGPGAGVGVSGRF